MQGLGSTFKPWPCPPSSLTCEGALDPGMRHCRGMVPSLHELVFSHHTFPHVSSTACHKSYVSSSLLLPLPLSPLLSSPSLSCLTPFPSLSLLPPHSPFSPVPWEGESTCHHPSPSVLGRGLAWHTPTSISRGFLSSLWVAAAGLLWMRKPSC